MQNQKEADHCPITRVCVKLDSPPCFTGPSVEARLPVSYPINDVEQLLAWTANDPHDRGQLFSVASVKHCPKISQPGTPKTLVCHDMKGGYLDDRFVQEVDDGVCYHSRYWSLVDTFVYFSHHFVTVPPVGWINAAHRNGVTVLGTLITEADAGYKRCKAIFSSRCCWQQVADQLVQLARFYGFDGWFINIENTIDTDKVSDVVDFVAYLTQNIHTLDGNGMVIWYDSVTNDGALQWQNELNDKNSCFYDVCDGIFLNYAWNDEKLQKSLVRARSPSTVYVGIDVFGRGCYGGGGFNTDVAITMIRSYELSAGVFAPGWVYETFGASKFDEMDEKFWKALQTYCYASPLAANAGLSSRFNPGCGSGDQHWCFLNAQDTMPLLPSPCISVEASDRCCSGQMVVDTCRMTSDTDEVIDAFNCVMLLPGGCATLITPADCDCPFVLRSDRGIIEPSSEGFRMPLRFGDEVKATHFICEGEVKVRGVAVKARTPRETFIVKFLQLLPGLRGNDDVVTSSAMTCDDVDWSKADEGSDQFYFGASLVFSNLPELAASSEVRCRISSSGGDSERVLGVSYCKQYRVCKLPVPNPMYGGPGCAILFVASHLSNAGLKVGESRLRVVYAEGI